MTLIQRLVKRAFDLTAAVTGLLALSPLLVLVGAAVKLSSAGPVLFIQQRVGRHGRLFWCVKFRTMQIGSESAGTITTSIDGRVTPVGRVMRSLKLDELPQLWNVLIGEMSLVGPRPDVAGYADCLTGDSRRLLELRPGITGPATLAFRHEEQLLGSQPDPKRYNDQIIWPEKVRLNLEYLENWSFWKDIGYILQTVLPWRRRKS